MKKIFMQVTLQYMYHDLKMDINHIVGEVKKTKNGIHYLIVQDE